MKIFPDLHMKRLWNIEFYKKKFRIYFDLVSNISNYYYDSWSYQIQLKWSALSNDFLCREILYHFNNVNFLLPQNKDLPHTSLTKLYNFIFFFLLISHFIVNLIIKRCWSPFGYYPKSKFHKKQKQQRK